MDIDVKIKYWLDVAFYDMETAKAMHKAKRYVYVGFMCHQVIEKVIKGYYWLQKNEEPPYIHNLLLLAKKSSLYELLSEEQRNLLDYLEPLNIRARYPRDKDELLVGFTKTKSMDIIKQTEALFKWTSQLLKK